MRRFCFEKHERLCQTKEFEIVKKKGERLVSRNFVILWLHNDLPYNRLGVIVSKKVGNAVCRNRIKRYLREMFRLNKYKFSSPPKDLLIIARKGSARLDMKRVTLELLPFLSVPEKRNTHD